MTPTKITRDVALQALLDTNEKLSILSVDLGRLEERFLAMEKAQRERNERQDEQLQETLDAIASKVNELNAHEKEIVALKKYHEDYPSLVWLLRNRTKATIAWTAFAVSMFILTVAPWANRRVLGAVLQFAGVPAPLVEVIVGDQSGG